MAGEEKGLPELDPVRDNATADDFKTKNKVYELILYTGPELEQFPRAQRRIVSNFVRQNQDFVLQGESQPKD